MHSAKKNHNNHENNHEHHEHNGNHENHEENRGRHKGLESIEKQVAKNYHEKPWYG